MGGICEEVRELIPWALNGTASAGERRLVHGHVMGCDDCRRELAQATILARRVAREVAALPGLTSAETAALRSAMPVAAGEPILEKLAEMLDALGIPRILGEMVRRGTLLTSPSPTLRVKLPMVAPVDVRLLTAKEPAR